MKPFALSNYTAQGMIRLGIMPSLIFFVFTICIGCRQNKDGDVNIIWNDNKAIGLSVPTKLLNENANDSLYRIFEVRLESNDTVAILGHHSIVGNDVVFKPLIPFSHGLTYKIFFRKKEIGKVKIPPADKSDPPKLVAVYPSIDTLPENLLKIYLQFSRPMREGESEKHITLLNYQQDTIPGIFLNLQPELWNKEGTALTLWLDPGRIKRDLIPNQQLGNPLKKGELYILKISQAWHDAQGIPLEKSYARQFFVGGRDSISPDPSTWKLQVPGARTAHPLVIETSEPLDFYLLQETIQIIDKHGVRVQCSYTIENKETRIVLIPGQPWVPGEFRMRVASYLEDLAGNNLEKVFDRDIQAEKTGNSSAYYEKLFVIRE